MNQNRIRVFLLFFGCLLVMKFATSQDLVDYNKLCEKVVIREDIYRTRISEIIENKDTSIFRLNFASMCDGYDSASISTSGDTLQLYAFSSSSFDDIVFCNCYYEILFTVVGYTQSQYFTFNDEPIFFDKNQFEPIKIVDYLIKDGDTINKIDQYERKLGYWEEDWYSGVLSATGFYKDGVKVGTWLVKENGKIKVIFVYEDIVKEGLSLEDEKIDEMKQKILFRPDGTLWRSSTYLDDRTLIQLYDDYGVLIKSCQEQNDSLICFPIESPYQY